MSGWRKSSHCNSGQCLEACGFRRSSHCVARECAEVGASGGGVAVRDSALRGRSPVLRFSTKAWAAFTAGLKAG